MWTYLALAAALLGAEFLRLGGDPEPRESPSAD